MSQQGLFTPQYLQSITLCNNLPSIGWVIFKNILWENAPKLPILERRNTFPSELTIGVKSHMVPTAMVASDDWRKGYIYVY